MKKLPHNPVPSHADFAAIGRDARPRRSKHSRRYVKKLTVRIGGAGGTILKFRDRSAWALLCLIKAGKAGVAPFERPAPRWSLYVSIFRQKGLAIETVFERHGGPYAGRRGRYVLHSPIEIIDREDVA